MKTTRYILFLFLVSTFFSCENLQKDSFKTDSNPSDSIKIVTIDSINVDKNEINSIELEKYKGNTALNKAPLQIELDNILTNKSIDRYYKEVYIKEKLISADDNKIISITDSLFTSDPETGLFYFIVFTKSMNGSDGFYSEKVGLSAFKFITQKTEWFANYFNIVSNLTDKDMDNWARYIYSEIQIFRENEEEKAIKELQYKLFKNIKGTKKEYKLIIERLIEKIKKNHSAIYNQ